MTDIREKVKKKYAEAITLKTSGGFHDTNHTEGCRGNSHPGGYAPSGLESAIDPITSNLYSRNDLQGLDPDLVFNSFGCGNPTALAQLNPGEIVLDLGSGAGLDVLLSAKRVGPQGKAYGLDMTDEMLAVAKKNQEKAGINNAEFLKGHIEEIPLSDNSVDVIISNCVINLSGDKDKVLHEAFRVLKPNGRFAVSDIVLKKYLPENIKGNMLAWAGCIAGALLEQEYIQKLQNAGFKDIKIEVTREYNLSDPMIGNLLEHLTEEEKDNLKGSIVSAFVKAVADKN